MPTPQEIQAQRLQAIINAFAGGGQTPQGTAGLQPSLPAPPPALPTTTPTAPAPSQGGGVMDTINSMLNSFLAGPNARINALSGAQPRPVPQALPSLTSPVVNAGAAGREATAPISVVEAGAAGREATAALLGPTTTDPGTVSEIRTPVTFPGASSTKDIEAALAKLQREADKFAGGDFTPDFKEVFKALEGARPEGLDGLSSLEKLSRFLGGAAAGLSSVDALPGNLGRGVAAAGGGGIRGAAGAQREDRAITARNEQINQQVDLAIASAKQQEAIADATGNREAAKAAIEAAKIGFNGRLAITKYRKASRESVVADLKAFKLRGDIELNSVALQGKTIDLDRKRKSVALGLGTDGLKTGSPAAAVAQRLVTEPSGPTGQALIAEARNVALDVVTRIYAGQSLGADASPEDVRERGEQLLKSGIKDFTDLFEQQVLASIALALNNDAQIWQTISNEYQGIKPQPRPTVPVKKTAPGKQDFDIHRAFIGDVTF